MAHRINPLWWPVLAVASPVLLPLLMRRNRVFVENRAKSEEWNRSRIQGANKLALPPLDFVEITVLSEWKTREGYLGEPGVSYLVKTPEGSLLYDVGFGAENRTLAHNAAKLGVRLEQIDAVALSHLHVDHIGGIWKADAARRRPFRVPGPLLATSCDEGVRGNVSVRHSRATHTHAVTAATPPHFHPELSPLSQSRAVRVIKELRPLNRPQRFRSLPHAAGISRLPQRHAFGQLSPVESTSSPTDSWHVDYEMAR